MYWKNVFPDYAVKQVFYEEKVERNDEHIITVMQSDLVTRCLLSVLKPACIHCVNNKRKFINEKDIDVGRSLSIFPAKDKPENAGFLLNLNEFEIVVKEHIALCMTQVAKQCPEIQLEKEYKLSQDTMLRLQQEIEACIRGFVSEMGSNISFRGFEITMGKILGDSSYVYYDQGYTPFS
jgi:histone H3/H4